MNVDDVEAPVGKPRPHASRSTRAEGDAGDVVARRILLPPNRHTLQSLVPNLFFRWGVNRGIHPLTYY